MRRVALFELFGKAGGGPACATLYMPDDLPVPGNYLGDGRLRVAVYRPSSGDWILREDDGTEHAFSCWLEFLSLVEAWRTAQLPAAQENAR
mgnify:CR=1 FL=1